jgi:hypothetical protein
MSNKIVIAIVVMVVAFLAFPLIPQLFTSKSEQETNDNAQNTPVPEDVAGEVAAMVAPPQPAPRQPSIMTQMQFDQVGAGMTYDQCVQFIGCEGERVGTAGTGGEEEYTWQLAGGTGEASLKFRNGVLFGKGFNSSQGRRARSAESMMSAVLPAQRPAAPPYICRSVYDGIKNGCTYAECVQLLGVEGTYLGRTTMSAGTRSADGTLVPVVADVYVWQNPAIQTRLTLSFRDGKLTAREISGSNWASGGS